MSSNNRIYEMNLPEWIDKNKFEKSFKAYIKNNEAKIIELKSTNAVPVGDNYTSDLFRTTIKYSTNKSTETNKLLVIIKCAGDNGAKNIFATELKLFEKETKMFGVTIPELHKILGRVCLSAECLQTELEPRGLLVLQDLTPLGYVMADRQKGLNMDHCFLVMEKLALLHASSAVLYEKNPKTMDEYEKGLLTNQIGNPVIHQLVMSGFQSTIFAIKNWPGYEKYALKLEALMDGMFERCMKVCQKNSDQFNVLNHGDLWTNNILFLYDSNNKPIDLRFIDFQFSVFTTPSVDLHYFLCTSLQQDIEKNHMKRLLSFYHEQLVANLKKYNYPNDKIPSFDQIHQDFQNRAFYAVMTYSAVAPITFSPPGRDDATYDEFAQGDKNEFRNSCFNHKVFKERMQTVLPYFDDLGLLD